jgi:regulation of enolase protein 1 (concanavalin A-like superfamily)
LLVYKKAPIPEERDKEHPPSTQHLSKKHIYSVKLPLPLPQRAHQTNSTTTLHPRLKTQTRFPIIIMAAPLTPSWQIASGAQVPSSFSGPFTITALPKTDIWRPSPKDNVYNAPRIFQKFELKKFKRISVTVFAPWKTQFDQGGIIVNLPSLKSSKNEDNGEGEGEVADDGQGQWIKCSIELHNTRANLGVVGTDRFSDWSLMPMSAEFHQKARFVVEWKPEEGKMFVYAGQVGNDEHASEQEEGEGKADGGGLVLLREICWVGAEDGEEERKERMVEVGVYAAKPTQDVSFFFFFFFLLALLSPAFGRVGVRADMIYKQDDDVDGVKGIEVTFSDLKIEMTK